MGLDQADLDAIAKMINAGVSAGISQYDSKVQPTRGNRTSAEIGSPEFAEDRTQINSLNNKWIFEAAHGAYWSEHMRLRREEAQLFGVAFDALNENNSLAKKLNNAYVTDVNDRARIRDGWDYAKSYDLSNPVTTGTGDTVRAGASTQQRAIDAGTVQALVASTTFQDAVQAAVSNAINALNPPLIASVGDAVAAAVKANMPAKAAA